MARELFQPKNDTQTSMVLMRRLSDVEKAKAAKGKLKYSCFMAITEKIGHDKRGNVIYRRNAKGEDIVVVHKERVAEIDEETAAQIVTEIETTELVLDDELPEVADAYLAWCAGEKTSSATQ